jgi:succinyl-diaminopimelate desuccinylase
VSAPGRREKPRVWVLTHLDVVPPGDRRPDGSWKGWDSGPFELKRAGDMIIGRGVSDNQQSIVSSIFGLRALLENDLRPARTVKLLFVSDEETGSHRGLAHVLQNHEDLFSPEDAIFVPDGGSEDSSMIEVAEKSVLWLEFRISGKQAHGSRPDLGVNAFRAASWLARELDEGFRERFDKTDHLFDLARSTFEPTMHGANVPNINTIPAEERFCFDCRVLPSYPLDSVLAYVEAQCRRADGVHGTTTEMNVVNRQDAPPATAPTAAPVRLLEPAIAEVYGVEAKTMGIGGMTLASLFRERGFAAAVWMTHMSVAHQVNESCSIAHMIGDARVFAHVYMSDF